MSSIAISKLFGVDGIVAVVTGGASGIGYMMAKGLIENGAAKVYVLGDKLAMLENAAKETVRLLSPISTSNSNWL